MHKSDRFLESSKRNRMLVLREQEQAVAEHALDGEKERLIEKLVSIDTAYKSLTGRKFEQYEEESKIPLDELFPEEGNILNIGDPWQVLDREGITTLEYETGEEAAFIWNPERFLHTSHSQLRYADNLIEDLIDTDPQCAKELQWRFTAVKKFSEQHISIEDYPKQAAVLYGIVRYISEYRVGAERSEEWSALRELWYVAMALARGFEDVYYIETVMKPAIEKEVLKRKGLTDRQEQALKAQLIESYRGKKKYKHTQLVKGAFPDTPFMDGQFDRVVASWSLSSHGFGVMDTKDFVLLYNELDRLLKKTGAAYIWPLHFSGLHMQDFFDSLRHYAAQGGDAGVVTGSELVWLKEDPEQFFEKAYYAGTLIIVPKNPSAEVRARIAEAAAHTRQGEPLAASA